MLGILNVILIFTENTNIFYYVYFVAHVFILQDVVGFFGRLRPFHIKFDVNRLELFQKFFVKTLLHLCFLINFIVLCKSFFITEFIQLVKTDRGGLVPNFCASQEVFVNSLEAVGAIEDVVAGEVAIVPVPVDADQFAARVVNLVLEAARGTGVLHRLLHHPTHLALLVV